MTPSAPQAKRSESSMTIDQDWTEYTLSRNFADPTGRKVRYKAEMTGTVLTFPHPFARRGAEWREAGE
jgi:hypothetical protein